MKKWLLICIAAIICAITCIYIFIPETIKTNNVIPVISTSAGISRMITSKENWKKWWNYALNKNENDLHNDSIFTHNDYKYSLAKSGYNSAIVLIQHNNNIDTSEITVLQLSQDTIGINWQCILHTSTNPIKRLQRYFEAVGLENNNKALLEKLKLFAEKSENIYGIKITEVKTKDSFIITKKQMFSQPPSMPDVYKIIKDLQSFASKNDLHQVDAPMLNILQDSGKYRVMVGLPIDKVTAPVSPVSFVKMVNGNFMFTRVKGGMKTVQNALDQIQLYLADYQRTKMAIPFQYLITDRIKEPDTTKWITEIYAPVY
jgi:hypothetical protein